MSTSNRHFTAVIRKKEHWLYCSSNPLSATKKIVSKLCASDKKKKVSFFIRETIQESKKKVYGPYIGEMKKIEKPIKLKDHLIKYESELTYKYKIIELEQKNESNHGNDNSE